MLYIDKTMQWSFLEIQFVERLGKHKPRHDPITMLKDTIFLKILMIILLPILYAPYCIIPCL